MRASDGAHRPNQRCAVAKIYLEATDLKDNATTAERRTRIDPKIDQKLVSAINVTKCGIGSRPRLEPGTCGLTVRRSRCQNKNCNQVVMCFSVGSVFWH